MEKTNKRIVLGMVDENGFEQDNRLYFRGGVVQRKEPEIQRY